jgi:hypothetical protein
MTIPYRILLRISNIPSKRYRENENTHFMLSKFFFRKSYRLWDNVENYGRPLMAVRQRVACWISKTTRGQAHASCRARACIHSCPPPPLPTHTQKYAILIAFPLQRWFCERASVLRYMSIACVVHLHEFVGSTYKCLIGILCTFVHCYSSAHKQVSLQFCNQIYSNCLLVVMYIQIQTFV